MEPDLKSLKKFDRFEDRSLSGLLPGRKEDLGGA